MVIPLLLELRPDGFAGIDSHPSQPRVDGTQKLFLVDDDPTLGLGPSSRRFHRMVKGGGCGDGNRPGGAVSIPSLAMAAADG